MTLPTRRTATALPIWLAAFIATAPSCHPGPAPAGPPDRTAGLTTTTLTYMASDRSALGEEEARCGTPMHVLVVEPDTGGPYPVLVFVTGSWGSYRAAHVQAILEGAARQGFVAASVEYHDELLPAICGQGWHKTRCMFSTSFNPESALGAVCKLRKADCDGRGVVVAGHSQGGAHAALARNFDLRVRGAWTMGFGIVLAPCGKKGPAAFGSADARILDNDRLRVFRGGHEGAPVASSNDITGLACPTGTTSCLLGAHGSGWYEPGDGELTAALNPNKHCFMEANPLAFGGRKVDCEDGAPHDIDPKFAAEPPATTYPSGLYQNVEWLKEVILPLGNQP
jgi:hypothetical protein